MACKTKEQIAADIRQWRDRAEEARRYAEQFRDPEAKRTMIDIVRSYDRLADLAEEALAICQ